MIKRQGLPLVICAPSGSGKTTLIKRLQEEFSLPFSVSCTTRPPRQGEVDGKDYYFVSQETFEQKIAAGELLEYAKVHNNYYGTLKSTIEQTLRQGQDLIFDIDVQGAAQLSVALAKAKFVFIFPPSHEILKQRLITRGTDTEETIKLRLKNAKLEIQSSNWFDAWIVNDDLDLAYDALRSFYLSCTLSPSLNAKFLMNLIHKEWF